MWQPHSIKMCVLLCRIYTLAPVWVKSWSQKPYFWTFEVVLFIQNQGLKMGNPNECIPFCITLGGKGYSRASFFNFMVNTYIDLIFLNGLSLWNHNFPSFGEFLDTVTEIMIAGNIYYKKKSKFRVLHPIQQAESYCDRGLQHSHKEVTCIKCNIPVNIRNVLKWFKHLQNILKPK